MLQRSNTSDIDKKEKNFLSIIPIFCLACCCN